MLQLALVHDGDGLEAAVRMLIHTPGSSLGRLLAVDRFWVELALPVARLRHLARDGGEPAPVEVALRDDAAWPDGVERTGRLDGVVRQLEDRTRLARLLVVVEDPRNHEAFDLPGVEVVCAGTVLSEAVNSVVHETEASSVSTSASD